MPDAERSLSGMLCERYAVADADSHIPPSHPRRLSEALPAAIDSKERLTYMDEAGVYYQVMYPNILGFHSHVFLTKMPRKLATLCVRAYNDWITEFCSADSRRLIPMMMLPFWDIQESVQEMRRAYEMGHTGVLFAARYDKAGFPRLIDDYWEPVLAQAQEMDLSMNFYVGLLATDGDLKGAVDQSAKLDFETDFPHATSLSPGPASESPSPKVVMEESLAGIDEDIVAKGLQGNATKLYHLESPARA